MTEQHESRALLTAPYFAAVQKGAERQEGTEVKKQKKDALLTLVRSLSRTDAPRVRTTKSLGACARVFILVYVYRECV